MWNENKFKKPACLHQDVEFRSDKDAAKACSGRVNEKLRTTLFGIVDKLNHIAYFIPN
jgi:hypothetical protein